VSTDGGTTWHPASGRGTWTYAWTPGTPGAVTIKARAIDDSANIGASASVTVTVTARSCPCSIWGSGATPAVAADPDGTANELGVKFRSDVAGQVTALRFYKGTGNTGTHDGHLWTATGTLLASVTFAGETASGWQQATLSTPVALTAGTTYVVSYSAPNGHYAEDDNYFLASATDAPPLHALKDGTDGPNGVYRQGTGFPNQVFQSANYWVDVVFAPASSGPDTTKPTVTSQVPAAGATNIATSTMVSATFSEAVTGSAVAVTGVAGSQSYNAATRTQTFTPTSALSAGTTYSVTVSGAMDGSNNVMDPVTWTFTTASTPPPPTCCSIWPASPTPANPAEADTAAVEIGTKFRSDVAGTVTGVRFYKGAGNTGTHVGNVWTTAGANLGTVTFTGESTTGWQQASFASPVAITAGTTYVVSYHAPVGRYAADAGFFATAGVDRPPLHALSDGQDGANGVYRYGTGSGFPNLSWQSSNYWVDVVFTPAP